MIAQIPSVFYYVALFAWPIVAVKFFKKYDLPTAIVLSIVLPFLFLPTPTEQQFTPIDLPVFPPIDKNFIPVFTILMILYFRKEKLRFYPDSALGKMAVVLLFVSPFLTVFNNTESIVYGPKVIPGLGLKDGLSLLMDFVFTYYFPFIVGYSFLGSKYGHEKLVSVIAVSGLIYSLLMLYEVRMSPQLHTSIYGYFPHEWNQQKRGDGFRPVVFLGHGLYVAMHFMVVIICIVACVKSEIKGFVARYAKLILVYSVVVLLLCKTMSAIIYCLLFFVVLILFKWKGLMRMSLVLCGILMFYPMIRSVVPLDEVVGFFQGVSEERAESLKYRIDNEEQLLARAEVKPLTGWGSWGRNHVFNEDTGAQLSVTDGIWIIVFGGAGWVGYISMIGLACFPVFLIWAKQKNIDKIPYSTLCLAAIVGVYSLDQIPNSSFNVLTFVISGALLGWVDRDLRRVNRRGSEKIYMSSPSG